MSIHDVISLYGRLSEVALREYHNIVRETKIIENKLRIFLVDGSYIDVWVSAKRPGVYAFHWERRAIDGTVYRYNNIPDKRARHLPTFPKHFHEGSEENIVGRDFGDDPEEILRNFLDYARSLMRM